MLKPRGVDLCSLLPPSLPFYTLPPPPGCPIAPHGLLKGDFYSIKFPFQFVFIFLYSLEDSVTMQDES